MSGEAFGLTPGPISDACADCGAESELVEISPNVFVLEIHHDSSCPAYRQIVARRGGES